jgi:hypothetical protein
MRLEELKSGQRFETNYCKLRGVVMSQGMMGTRVKFDRSGRKVQIERKAKWGEEGETKVVEFTAPATVEIISSGTEVTILEG